MSAGRFINTRYQTNTGAIHSIRVQPETTLATFQGGDNEPPSGIATGLGSVKISNSNRSFGIKPRMVTISWSGAVPDGYEPGRTLRIPVLTPDTWNAIPAKGGVGVYLGLPVDVVGKSPERIA